DAEIVQSILRFIEHEAEFPGEFAAYAIVSSTGFWEEQANSSNLNLRYLLGLYRQRPEVPAVARFIAALKRWETRHRTLDSASISWDPMVAGTVLSKLSELLINTTWR